MSQRLAYWFFIATFPGYFFYHTIKSSFPTPYIGWFSAVLLICAFIAVPMSLISVFKSGFNRNSLVINSLFYLLILLMVSSVASSALLIDKPYITSEGNISNLLLVAWLVALYEIGKGLNVIKPGKHVAFIMLWFLVGTIYFYDSSQHSIVMPLLPGDNNEAANYQGMSRSISCFAIVLIPFLKNRTQQVYIAITAFVLLAMAGSRTELITFMIVGILYAYLHFSTRLVVAISLLGLIGASSYVAFVVPDIFTKTSEYLSSDPSVAQRSEIFRMGMEGIYKNPILGDYLGQVRDFGATGYYIHNALSMWQQFGFSSFAIYAFLVIYSVLVAVREILSGNKSRHVEALLYVSVSCLIGVVTTKAVFWPIPALAFGLAANVLRTKAVRVHAPDLAISPNSLSSGH